MWSCWQAKCFLGPPLLRTLAHPNVVPRTTKRRTLEKKKKEKKKKGERERKKKGGWGAGEGSGCLMEIGHPRDESANGGGWGRLIYIWSKSQMQFFHYVTCVVRWLRQRDPSLCQPVRCHQPLPTVAWLLILNRRDNLYFPKNKILPCFLHYTYPSIWLTLYAIR